jgi:hypothetical protein
MGPTEKLEQEYIDAFLEEERTPNHELGRLVLEKTDLGQLEYDSLGTYIDGSW